MTTQFEPHSKHMDSHSRKVRH